ncbi:Helix-turn-helix [Amphritea atlantica]|uniref:Helix-turn-helix n=1 Tax=Amphritea atlantica TaxID=355243 RepID=A0A1H9EM34_9GAMM|nr:helix-turn-helix transcriptional regulator [Amphritea atlantica]SEQ26806.1 Helix-turn-helix [Amphritea atlantica]
MPDSLKINPRVIKHLRKKEKVSQVALATAIGISDRGVQKIEASGNTSSETATKLAQYFGLSVNELMEGNIHCKAEYWAKDPVTGEHLIFSYAHNLLEKLKNSWADYRRYFYSEEKVIINIQISKGHYRLTSSCEDAGFDWEFEFRRVWFNQDMGLCWTPESEFESELMEEELFGMAREEADDVFVNGARRFTDKGVYQVTVYSWDVTNQQVREEAFRTFKTLSEVQNKLAALLQKFSPKELNDTTRYVDFSAGKNHAGLCVEAWPKVRPRLPTFEGVVGPIRVHVIRQIISDDSDVHSIWRKSSKNRFVNELTDGVKSDRGSDIENSRVVEWGKELNT